MQDDSFALENLTLLTKLSRTPVPSSPSLSYPVFTTALSCRMIQTLCMFLAKVFIAVKAPLQKTQSFKKTPKHFLGESLNLSFFLCCCCSISFYSWTHTNLNFTSLHLGLHININLQMQNIECSSNCNGNTGAYFCSR